MKKSMHPQQVTVWREFWSSGIVGQWGTGHCYNQWRALSRHVNRFFYFTKLKRMTPTTFGFNRAALRVTKPNLHSNYYAMSWKIKLSAKILHWDSIKDKRFTNRPEPIGELLYEIEVTIGEISAEFHENTLKNWVGRIRYSKASDGSHLNEIEFHV